jgi:hypothetical protein
MLGTLRSMITGQVADDEAAEAEAAARMTARLNEADARVAEAEALLAAARRHQAELRVDLLTASLRQDLRARNLSAERIAAAPPWIPKLQNDLRTLIDAARLKVRSAERPGLMNAASRRRDPTEYASNCGEINKVIDAARQLIQDLATSVHEGTPMACPELRDLTVETAAGFRASIKVPHDLAAAYAAIPDSETFEARSPLTPYEQRFAAADAELVNRRRWDTDAR